MRASIAPPPLTSAKSRTRRSSLFATRVLEWERNPDPRKLFTTCSYLDARDEDLAAAWRTANEIRKRPGAAKTRLLALLQALSPSSADQDQLTYVAKIKSWQRRVRELDEEGWEIRSNIDEPELAPGSYRIATLVRRPPRARQAIKLRYEILERDKFTCQDCGRKRGDPSPGHEAPLSVGPSYGI